ncbi:chemotaxis protein CheA [Chitinilyticum piscinae]|uniref:Chemotaxis protein CheA n=1 Tax=Chitinilyticum piscinae TaxID=2866724 RepID=A0A8J7FHP4_9NEIS|nr:chemotaxis protein CheA [Chitinilyticum piscinae]MBE9609648.1 chemotaxis protein CheA [Chitinilyticum piscinae]
MSIEAGLQAFIDEARELLQQMEAILLDAETAQADAEVMNALFRTVHTIKGSAGLFALDAVVAFTHEVENVLDQVRGGTLALSDTLASVLLRCHDHLEAMIAALGRGGQMPDEAAGAALLSELHAHAALSPSQAARTAPAQTAPATADPEQHDWLLYLGLSGDLLHHGIDPAALLRYLASQIRIVQVLPLPQNWHGTGGFDPEHNYLHFALHLQGNTSREQLLDVFEFAREGSCILACPVAEASPYLQAIAAETPPDMLAAASTAWQQLGWSPQVQAAPRQEEPEASGTPVAAENGPATVKKSKPAEKSGESHFLRVEAEKLDTLINLIGELVIAGAAGNLLAKQAGSSSLLEWSQGISNLIEQIRTGALSMRMVQVGEIFNRFPRVVRDVAKELGKQIELKISGADAELDKSMVEKLGDPLMHIVRNAIDHGIEPAEVRLARGKPAQGTVQLNAYHESGSIVIEVSDDGGGLNRHRILQKAVDRGLISADAQLAEQEIYALIFEPGFSTAEQITNISGRGVGMDVVRRSIEQLRGMITIESELEVGTVFRIRLPLTLAIIDGFMVKVAESVFVVPLEAVVECVELPPEMHPDDSSNCLNLRNELLPLLRLATFFDLKPSTSDKRNVVVLQIGDRKVGLVVDVLLGEFQTVIKPLGDLFRSLKAIGGSTILGNGQVALILDVNELVQYVVMRESARYGLEKDRDPQLAALPGK